MEFFSYGEHENVYIIAITIVLVAVVIFSVWSKYQKK
jgi:hypothetical protein